MQSSHPIHRRKNSDTIKLILMALLVGVSLLLNSCGKKEETANTDNQIVIGTDGKPIDPSKPGPGTGTTDKPDSLKNYIIALDDSASSNKINEIMVMINGLNSKFDANSFKQLDDNSLIIAGSGYLTKQPIFVKTDLKGNPDTAFNGNMGYSTIPIPDYNFQNYSGRLIVNPATKDIFLMGISYYKNDTSKSLYTLVSIKADGTPNNIFNGKPYMIDNNHNVYELKDMFFEDNGKFTTVFFETPLKSFACSHEFTNPLNYSCSVLGTIVQDEVFRLKPVSKDNYYYVGVTRTVPKLWSTNSTTPVVEHKLQGDNIGFALDFLTDNTGTYIVGCSPLTDIISRLTIWKLNSELAVDQTFEKDGKRLFLPEQSGCFSNIFKVKNKIITISREGPKVGTNYMSFVTMSEIDFNKNERKLFMQDYSGYSIKAAEQIGDDIYLIINNTTLSTTKLIKTKITEATMP